MTISERIGMIIDTGNWSQLPEYLSRMSNSEFRKAQQVVRENVLPTLDNSHFWEAYKHFVAYRPQAFLSGIVAIKHLVSSSTLDFDNPHVGDLANSLTSVQKGKILSMALPYLNSDSQITGMFRALDYNSPESQALILANHTTTLAYYVLFKTLRNAPDNHQLCIDICRHLMKKHDDLSFNMASLLREFFGLNEIKSQLSLNIEHYELSFIDASFQRFKYVVEGRRPFSL